MNVYRSALFHLYLVGWLLSKQLPVNAVRFTSFPSTQTRCLHEPHRRYLRSEPGVLREVSSAGLVVSAVCLRKTALLRSRLFFQHPCALGTLLSSASIPYKALPEAMRPHREISAYVTKPRYQKATLWVAESETMFPLAFRWACCWTKNRFVTSFPRPHLNLCSWAWTVSVILALDVLTESR